MLRLAVTAVVTRRCAPNVITKSAYGCHEHGRDMRDAEDLTTCRSLIVQYVHKQPISQWYLEKQLDPYYYKNLFTKPISYCYDRPCDDLATCRIILIHFSEKPHINIPNDLITDQLGKHIVVRRNDLKREIRYMMTIAKHHTHESLLERAKCALRATTLKSLKETDLDFLDSTRKVF